MTAVKNLVLLIIWSPLRWMYYLLPRRVSMLLSDFAGRALFWLNRSGRNTMRKELQATLGDLPGYEHSRIAATAFRLLTIEEGERLFFDKGDRVLAMMEYDGLERLDAALSGGKGAILALMHFGNHLLLIPALGYRGYTVYQLAERGPTGEDRERPGLLQSLVVRRRRQIGEKMPAKILVADEIDKRIFYKVLQNKNVLLCAVDGRLGQNMQYYDFFGRRMLLSNGIFRIAQYSGAPVLPLFITRMENGRHRLTIEAPLVFDTPDAGVQHFLDIFKRYFAAFPHHYAANLMFEKMRSRKDRNNPLFEDLSPEE
jgi:lauroyl/myristoyl acyltransferase